MALNNINVSQPNDHMGDNLRNAFIKVNNNFDYLQSLINDGATQADLAAAIAQIEAELTVINDELDGKANVVHTHTMSQITGLVTALNSKVNTSTFNTQIGEINASISEINELLNTLIADIQNLNGLELVSDEANKTLSLVNGRGETMATVNLGYLNDEGVTLNFNDVDNTLELVNEGGTVISSVPVSDFFRDLIVSADFDATTPSILDFFDGEGNIVDSVQINIENVEQLQFNLDGKISQGGDSFAAPVVIGSNDDNPLELKTNNVVRVVISQAGLGLRNNAALQNYDSPGSFTLNVGGINASARLSRDLFTDEAALIIANDNATSAGNIAQFQSNIGGTIGVRAGVRKDGRVYGADATAPNDFVTRGQFEPLLDIANNVVHLTGDTSQHVSGTLSADILDAPLITTNKITIANTPVNSVDGTNKGYVDTLVTSGLTALDANVVHLTGFTNQNIVGGIFSTGNFQVSGTTITNNEIETTNGNVSSSKQPTQGKHLTRKDYVDGLDANNVKLTGMSGQTISGNLTVTNVVSTNTLQAENVQGSNGTFAGNITANAVIVTDITPSSPTELTAKAYVDSAISAATAGLSADVVHTTGYPSQTVNGALTITSGITTNTIAVSGNETIGGSVTVGGNASAGLAPTQAQHLTRKDYVDGRLDNKADLVNGLVPASQLPGFVDNVVIKPTFADFPQPGEENKLYIAEDTNISYRWGGTSYVIVSTALALGETSSTAYRGDRGKIAYDHSQTIGNPHDTQIGDIDNLQATLDAKALDANVIHKTGNETKTGNFTLGGALIVTGSTTTNTLNVSGTTTINGLTTVNNDLIVSGEGNFTGVVKVAAGVDAEDAVNVGQLDGLVDDKADKINTLTVKEPIEFGVNLDDYLETGLYNNDDPALANVVYNYPIDQIAGNLEVVFANSTYVYQKYHGQNNIVYTRVRISGDWSDWSEVPNDANVVHLTGYPNQIIEGSIGLTGNINADGASFVSNVTGSRFFVSTDAPVGDNELTRKDYVDGLVNDSVADIEGQLDNKADLVNGVIPASQIPGSFDEIQEGTYVNETTFNDPDGNPYTPSSDKLYVDTTSNIPYRWTGSAYISIGSTLALGETSSTAYRGDRGKIAYDHSQITNGNPHNTTVAQISGLQTTLDGKANVNGSNATGTWPINISGNAANTVLWNGRPADWTPEGVDAVALNTLGGLDNAGVFRRYTSTIVKPWLGITTSDVSGLSTALAGKANTDGSNAAGTWSNITAGNSNALGGYQYVDAVTTNINTYLVRDGSGSANTWRVASKTTVANDVRDNATGTWNIDINGRSGRALTVQDYINGSTLSFGWNGSQATFKVDASDFGSTWPINISGLANNSLALGYYPYTDTLVNAANIGNFLVRRANNADWVVASPFQVATALGVNAKANDADVVHKAGTEAITGDKIFNSRLRVGSDVNVGDRFIDIQPSTGTMNIQGYLAGIGQTNISLQAEGSNVGVGTTNPISKFQVRAGTDVNTGFVEAIGGRMAFTSYNDAGDTNIPLDIYASEATIRLQGIGLVAKFEQTQSNIYTPTIINNNYLRVTHVGNPSLQVQSINGGGFPLIQLIDNTRTDGKDWNIENGRSVMGRLGFYSSTSADAIYMDQDGTVAAEIFKPVNGGGITWRGASNKVAVAASSGTLLFYSNVDNGDAMRILSNNNVGIGYTGPSYKLDVNGTVRVGGGTVNAGGTKLIIKNDAGKQWSLISGQEGNNENYFTIKNETDGTIPMFLLPTGQAIFNNSIGIGVAPNNGVTLQVKGESTTQSAGYIYNYNTTAGTSRGLVVEAGTNNSDYSAQFRKANGTPIMTINGAGNVGIGVVPTSGYGAFAVSGNSDFFGAINCSTGGSFGSELLVGTPSGIDVHGAVNIEYIQQKFGNRGTWSGNPSLSTTITIPHGLGATPAYLQLTFSKTGPDEIKSYEVTLDGTNIKIIFMNVPSETSLRIWWNASLS